MSQVRNIFAQAVTIMQLTHKSSLTFHSKEPMAIPVAAAVPAIPTKWPLPMLLAKSDAPICEIHGYIY